MLIQLRISKNVGKHDCGELTGLRHALTLTHESYEKRATVFLDVPVENSLTHR